MQGNSAVDGLGLRHVFDLRAASKATEHTEYVPAGAAYQRVAGMYEPNGVEMWRRAQFCR